MRMDDARYSTIPRKRFQTDNEAIIRSSFFFLWKGYELGYLAEVSLKWALSMSIFSLISSFISWILDSVRPLIG